MKRNQLKIYSVICFDRENHIYVNTKVIAYNKGEAIRTLRKNDYSVRPEEVILYCILDDNEQENIYKSNLMLG